jgi:DMSO/TMAO reductase YedYZ heme-binding membrane subunit
MTAKFYPLCLAAFAALGAVALALAVGTDTIEQAQLAARWTARTGFPILILTYSASSLVRLWPNARTKAMLRHRRQWGLGFALAHSIHLAALTTYSVMAAQMPTMATLVGGGGAYILLYAMVLTSNDAAMRAMGVGWKRLHRTGIHALWFVYTFSYFGRLFNPDLRMQGLILLPVCLAALGLRLAAWAKARRRLAAVV